jgi:hypothetical protein
MASGQISAAVTAIKEKGILSGKRIERQEVGGPGEYEVLSRRCPVAGLVLDSITISTMCAGVAVFDNSAPAALVATPATNAMSSVMRARGARA